MREILFRGKRIDNCEWVEGFYFESFTGVLCILKEYDQNIVCAEIIPETVGQYTGMNDKNGKRIFEGDIVSGENYLLPTYDNRKLNIYFDKESCGFRMNVFNLETLEVIGNIHDHPELLEK